MFSDGFEVQFATQVLHLYKNTSFVKITENDSLGTSRSNQRWIGDFGFTINAIENLWGDILTLIFFGIKMCLVKALSFLPIKIIQNLCQPILRQKVKLFLFEMVAINPTIFLAFGDIIGRTLQYGFLHQFQ